MNNLFGNNQTQTQNTGNSLFTNQNTNNKTNSLFGNINTNPNQGLFGNNINNNDNQSKTGGGLFGNILNNNPTNNTKDNNKGGLFGNIQTNNNNLFGANNTASNTTNNNPNTLFGAPNTSNSNAGGNPIFGNFQNNNNNNKNDAPSPIFGTNITQTTTIPNNQNPNEPKKQEPNSFSLFTQTKSPEKPKENNTSTNNQNKPGQPSLFQNPQPGQTGGGNLFGNPSLFGAPKQEEKKTNVTNVINTQAQTQSQTQSQNKENEEKKKQEGNISQNNLFGNNINKQAEPAKNNLFGAVAEKSEQKQSLNVPNNSNINQNNQNPNQININNQQKNEIKVNEINVNKNLYLKIPEKPFDLSLSNSKELEDFEKSQMLYKSNKEILEEFKTMLKTQKEKYKQCVKNTRTFEKKLMGILDITNANSKFSEINEMKGKLFIEKLNGINQRSKNLENILKNFNDRLDESLIPVKDNIMNSDKFLLNENNSEKFKFYDNFEQISEKCYLIEDTLNQAEINFLKREKEMEEKNKNDSSGIWIERNRKKIFVDQNEMNNLFSECYDGLTNLKNMQDNIDKKYEMLKSKLLNSTGNNYINYNYNFNNI